MNAYRSLISICFLSALALPVYAGGKLLVINQGMDGDTRLYNIYCPDGGKGQVQQKFNLTKNDEPQVITGPDGKVLHVDKSTHATLLETCAAREKGKEVCNNNWTVDQAAQSICR